MPLRLAEAPQFGVYHVNLNEAGLLIAKCLWFRGELRQIKLSKDPYDFFDENLEALLAKPAAHFASILIKPIETGSLPACNIRRDIQDKLLADKTYVDVFKLADWLEARGISLGAAFEEDYLKSETELAAAVAHCTAAHRQMQRLKPHLSDEALEAGAEVLFMRHRIAELETEIETLREPDKHAHPISEKQKLSYLNIIGALLGLLLGMSPSGDRYSKFDNQQAIIDGIHGNFGEPPGLSTRNLQAKFAEARRMLKACSM